MIKYINRVIEENLGIEDGASKLFVILGAIGLVAVWIWLSAIGVFDHAEPVEKISQSTYNSMYKRIGYDSTFDAEKAKEQIRIAFKEQGIAIDDDYIIIRFNNADGTSYQYYYYQSGKEYFRIPFLKNDAESKFTKVYGKKNLENNKYGCTVNVDLERGITIDVFKN